MLYVKNAPSEAVKPVKPILGEKPIVKPQMRLRIFLQRSEYNFEKNEYCKYKTKILLPAEYSMSFPD